jgi:hypothetical protein
MTKKVLTLALEALEQIAAYRPLTFAECSDAEAVMRIAENAIPALREALAKPALPVTERTWVGLTDREFEEVTHGMEDLEDCWIAIEAKLKGKNHV